MLVWSLTSGGPQQARRHRHRPHILIRILFPAPLSSRRHLPHMLPSSHVPRKPMRYAILHRLDIGRDHLRSPRQDLTHPLVHLVTQRIYLWTICQPTQRRPSATRMILGAAPPIFLQRPTAARPRRPRLAMLPLSRARRLHTRRHRRKRLSPLLLTRSQKKLFCCLRRYRHHWRSYLW